MGNQTERITEKVNEFIAKLSPSVGLEYEIEELDIEKDVNVKQYSDTWAGKVGVYIFINENGVLYIGRALKSSFFGKRIADNTQKIPNVDLNEWQKEIEDPSTKIILYKFKNEKLDFWAASLEIFLIDHLEPKYNKRRG
ncbi:MAG: hypothetical protein JXD23_08645 [Spirochaetales bacterium]|nr:hypothetical protein [Spirochaetales bacterium]